MARCASSSGMCFGTDRARRSVREAGILEAIRGPLIGGVVPEIPEFFCISIHMAFGEHPRARSSDP